MKKRVLSIVMVVALLLTMTACGDKKTENKEANKLKDITIVLDWTPNTNHTGLYAALENGYYKEAGLNVSIVQPPEDGASVLVASGKAQFGIDFQDYLTPAFSKDSPLPITAVAAIIQHNTSGIISMKGRGITSPKGMCGKTYATWDLETEKAMLKYLVEKDGGKFEDVKLVPSTVTDVISAIQTDIDCVWVYYAWDGIATKVAGVDTDFFNFADYDKALDYYSPVIVANNEFLKNNPKEAKAFLAATKKGYEFAMEHPEDAADILCKAAPELDKKIVTESQKWLVDQYQADAESWGVFQGQRWDAFYEWLFENGVIKEAIPKGTGYSNDYIQ
ncbi:MAG: ABC transporter substrate-binding protein [Lachnospiraceae bacterium]